MPKLGLVMEKGVITKWFKKVGDHVEKGEPLFEVETEKITCEIPATDSGILRALIVPENTEVPVGTVVAIIADADEGIPEEAIQQKPESINENPNVVPVIPPSARSETQEGGRILPLSEMRRTIADRMSKSHMTSAPVTIAMQVNAEQAQKLCDGFKNKDGPSPSITDVVVEATAKALKEYPIMNSNFEGDRIRLLEDINIGVAVAVEGGLVVPVVRNTDKLSLKEIAAVNQTLQTKARTGSISLDELAGGTFTVSNLGMFGVDLFTPIINMPQAGILGVGRVEVRPLIINGQVVAKPMMYLALTFDHRIIDGAPAARFLRTVKQNIENPSRLST